MVFMAEPTGLGFWVAYTPTMVVEKLVSVGAKWVAPRAGLNGWNDGGLRTKEDLQRYKDAGLQVFPWIYPTPQGWKSTLDGFQRLVSTQLCDGLILDAEAEWCDGKSNGVAAVLVEKLREAFPTLWIAHAPMDYINYHPKFPWVEFGELDAVLPQVYAWEHDDHGHVFHLERVEAAWAAWEKKNPLSVKPRWPIGCTYRPGFRGTESLTPLPDQWNKIAMDVEAFLDHPLCKGKPVSLYSLEAAYSSGQPTAVIEMLQKRAKPLSPPHSDELHAGTEDDAVTTLRAGDGAEDHKAKEPGT
jgi:hypothetical protein